VEKVSLTLNITNGGQVTGSANGTSYKFTEPVNVVEFPKGTVVTLGASAKVGLMGEIDNWVGDYTPGHNSTADWWEVNVTMDGNKTITAAFKYGAVNTSGSCSGPVVIVLLLAIGLGFGLLGRSD
jgi:hypothetical protein